MDAQVAQRLCHMLASCEEATRTRALRSVSKLFAQIREPVDELTLVKITKALYYMLWMTDKPLKVRKVAVAIVETQNRFADRSNRFLFFTALFRSISMEWPTLDKNRLDKMLLFVRIVVAALLEFLNDGGWAMQELEEFEVIVLDSEGIFNKRSRGLAFQFLQVFFDEFRENQESLTKSKKFAELSACAFLQLMKPFLVLALTLDNKHVLNTLSMYVLKRAANVPVVPMHGFTLAMDRLSESQLARPFVKNMLKEALVEFGEMLPVDDELERHVSAAISAIESAVQKDSISHTKEALDMADPGDDDQTMNLNAGVEDTRSTRSLNRKGRNVKVGTTDEPSGETKEGSDIAPGLVDVSDMLDTEMYDPDDMDGEGFISLAEAFGPRNPNRTLGKHMKEIATLDTLRKYIVANGHEQHKLLKKLNTPRMRRQMTLLALHKIRWLNPDRRFKCARKLHRIMTITETAESLPSRRRSIDVAKALHNIKHTTPEKSIVRKRNRKSTEPKRVVFNLKNNQVATIPKKVKSTYTVPLWY
ncbi:Ribosomal RNA processing protein 1 -like protein A [Babesia sp. Xinjiang]|uniref:Ribosomal RNA processing protein 1 -like protein A n=1 Tax=Babesia sp. Xinjiang TaxID=462227 RepID=UPI000A2223A4|nr:Ribosomal RNA processing protein 1 -like protein A [Babesia sp. Xinjiang]ORM40047.1 Ribosomal RNA processing protein 1 -like protein A [Babesia sp. Xinjiang]